MVLCFCLLFLLFGSFRGEGGLPARGGLVVLIIPCGDGVGIRVQPRGVILHRLEEAAARAVGHDGAVLELLDAKPLGAEAGRIVDDLVVGLLDEVLKIRPGEACRPEEVVQAEVAGRILIWMGESITETLAIREEALAEGGQLVRLFTDRERVRDAVLADLDDEALRRLPASSRRHGEDHRFPGGSKVGDEDYIAIRGDLTMPAVPPFNFYLKVNVYLYRSLRRSSIGIGVSSLLHKN